MTVHTARAITCSESTARLSPFKARRFAPTPRRGAGGLDRASAEPVLGSYVMAHRTVNPQNDSIRDFNEGG